MSSRNIGATMQLLPSYRTNHNDNRLASDVALCRSGSFSPNSMAGPEYAPHHLSALRAKAAEGSMGRVLKLCRDLVGLLCFELGLADASS